MAEEASVEPSVEPAENSEKSEIVEPATTLKIEDVVVIEDEPAEEVIKVKEEITQVDEVDTKPKEENVKTEVMNNEGKNEEDVDVPEDFFDDFSNQDFMDGLDIVDAWVDEDGNLKPQNGNDPSKGKKKKSKAVKQREKAQTKATKKGRSRSRSRKRSFDPKDRRSSRDKYHWKPKPAKSREHSLDLRNVIKSKERSPDSRRDPMKTRRDIERDKQKCAIDKEKKIIKEKLLVVETGLVPPGMEMEVNLSEIKEKVREAKRQKSPIVFKRSKSAEKKEVPQVRSEIRPLNRDRDRFSIERRRTRSRSKDAGARSSERNRNFRRRSRTRSPRRSPIRRNVSPGARDRDRDRERERERDRERLRHQREREASLERERAARRSPRRRSRSNSRERWTVKKFARRRSPSPERKYRDKKEEKMSFLEEIRIKLNEPLPLPPQQVIHRIADHIPPMYRPGILGPGPPGFPQQQMPMNMPMQMNMERMPAPVPAPAFNPPPQQQYDQQFFIGEPEPVPPVGHNFGPPMMGPPMQQPLMVDPNIPPQHNMMQGHQGMMFSPGGMPHQQQQQQPQLQMPQQQIRQLISPQENIQKKNEPDKSVNQLFEDKKISLSDFLRITAKPEVQTSSPAHLQKKVNVLSRCQDTLKFLEQKIHFNGPLLVQPIEDIQPSKKIEGRSPLLASKDKSLRYIIPRDEKGAQFKDSCTSLLKKVGVYVEEPVDEPIEIPDSPPPPEAPKIGSLVRRKKDLPIPPIKVLPKMVQTDPWKCYDCEKRKAKKFATVGVQRGSSRTESVGTQVTESDITNRGIHKNQSIANMTPAQLLGNEPRQKPDDSRRYDAKSFFDMSLGRSNFPSFSNQRPQMVMNQSRPFMPPMNQQPGTFPPRMNLPPNQFGGFDNRFNNSNNSNFNFRR